MLFITSQYLDGKLVLMFKIYCV